MSWQDLPGALVGWVQNAGAVAAIGLVLWSIAWVAQHRGQKIDFVRYLPVTLPLLIACFLYTMLGVFFVAGAAQFLPAREPRAGMTAGDWLLAGAGAAALFAVCAPVIATLFTSMRWQRIYALASLSFKEATRSRRVVLVFSVMALIFLFAGWFVPFKAEDQVRNYVRVVYWSMLPLFLLASSLLGAFGIPSDVKSQSIHTIVTKPVEKFELVLGRFLGYAALITIAMACVSALSLLYVVRGVNPEAHRESFKARVPIYGFLSFHGTKGDSVGREFDYRRYVGGPHPQQPNAPKQFAIWSYFDLPSGLASRGVPVPFEFTFDIFRLTKGQESKGIYCTFTFADGRLSMAEVQLLHDQVGRERVQRMAALQAVADPKERQSALDQIEDELTKKHGIYIKPGFEVTDYHTQSLEVPASLFQRLQELETERPRVLEDGYLPPMMRVLVNVDRTSMSQMLGVAPRDLYLLDAERPFWQNFLKGVIGMWFTCLLVLGVVIALSTYLSGVISWLCVIFLFIAGLNTDFIQKLAENKADGGGPFEAFYRIATRHPMAAPIDASPTGSLLISGDDVYRWFMRRFLNVIPDVGRYDLHQYVANGFDISWGQVLLVDNLLPLIGYLVPWAVLAFYLMKFREIANPT